MTKVVPLKARSHAKSSLVGQIFNDELKDNRSNSVSQVMTQSSMEDISLESDDSYWSRFYIGSLRFRFTLFFLISCGFLVCQLLSMMLIFLLSVFVPLEENHPNIPRLTIGLFLAPLLLVSALWISDRIVILIADCWNDIFMLELRVHLAMLFHYIRHHAHILVKVHSKDNTKYVYTGPELDTSTLALVDLFMPVVLEIIMTFAFWFTWIATGSFAQALLLLMLVGSIGSYFLSIMFAALQIFKTINLKASGIIGYLGTKITKGEAVADRLLNKEFKENQVKVIQYPGTSLLIILTNIKQQLAFLNCSKSKEVKKAASPRQSTMDMDLEATSVSGVLCCFNGCQQWSDFLNERITWWIRCLFYWGCFYLMGILIAFQLFPLSFGWFVEIVIISSMAYAIYNSFKGSFTQFYVFVLLAFIIMGFGFIIVGFQNAVPSSDADIIPPSDVSTSLDYTQLDTNSLGYFREDPICHSHWNGLTALDISIMASLVYSTNEEILQESLQRSFGNTTISDVNLIYSQLEIDALVGFIDVEIPSLDLRVIAVRGTATVLSVYQDSYLYIPVLLLKFIRNLIPGLSFFPLSFQQELVNSMGIGWARFPVFFDPLEQYINDIKENDNARVLLTGHSLGGSLAQILAVRTRSPAVAWSPPGIVLLASRLRLDHHLLRTYTTTLLPDRDLVTKIDLQYGNIYNVPCEGYAVFECHRMPTSICTIEDLCGDVRNRDFSRMCSAIEQQSGLEADISSEQA